MHSLALVLQEPFNPEQIQHLLMAFIPIIFVFVVIGLVIVIIPCWFICKKAGFSPWLSMLCLIPSVGRLVLLYVLAFADWKVVPAMPATWGPPQPYPPQPPFPPQR